MNLPNFPINWFDLVILGVLAVGIVRGRKRGMSEEVLDLVKWVLILITAGHLYQPIGDTFADMTCFSRLTSYVSVYATIVVVLHVFFTLVRRALGDKLVTSDAFGAGEYYMGMVAGLIRYFCVIVVVLAFLNARQYTAEEITDSENFQENNFGSIRLPTVQRMQSTVFDQSCSGNFARNYLATYLIRRTVPEDKRLGGGQSIPGHGGNLEQYLEKKSR